MDFSRLSSHPQAACLPPEILVAAEKRSHYFRNFYNNHGLEVADFIGDLYVAWAENPDMEPDILVARLNSKIRRGNLEDNIVKSKIAADIFFDSHDSHDIENEGPLGIAEIDSDHDVMENLLLRAKAEDEMQEIMAFAMSKFGLGLKRKTISDYIRKDMQGFIALAKNGIAERKKAGVRWQRYEKNGRGRPAHFELEHATITDPFAPRAGEYYKSPDKYNSLRRIRRERKRNVQKTQLSLAI